ncbi:hypothetical protein M9458_052165, partial [Cirrhinus mrigala]
ASAKTVCLNIMLRPLRLAQREEVVHDSEEHNRRRQLIAEHIQSSASFILHRRRARMFYDLLGRVAEGHVTLCFDMMQNMVLPKAPIGKAYYSRQMYLYLFGVVVPHGENSHQKKDDVHLYVWQENESSKDSNMIASALSDCLEVRQIQGASAVQRLLFWAKQKHEHGVHAHGTSS